MTEQWVQRTATEYAAGFNDLLPTGPGWPREQSTVLQAVINGLAQIWGDNVEASAALLLLTESDPRQTLALLPDWERNWALPDDCAKDQYYSVDERHNALVTKMTMLGRQDRQFFIDAAATFGYTITIQEWSPFMCGVSRCGNTTNLDVNGNYRWEVGSPDMRFYWKVRVHALRLTWFRASSGQAGVDPHLRIAGATDLECLLRRWKPAHTEVLFDYSDLPSVTETDTELVVLPL